MKRFVYWIKKAFNKSIHCGSFCPKCEYYEVCRSDN